MSLRSELCLEGLYPGDHQHGLCDPGPQATQHPLTRTEHALAPGHQALEMVKCPEPARGIINYTMIYLYSHQDSYVENTRTNQF